MAWTKGDNVTVVGSDGLASYNAAVTACNTELNGLSGNIIFDVQIFYFAAANYGYTVCYNNT